MAGRIRDEDVALVKERAHIEDVVREHVTLVRAGTGRLKGLCPFHDEKTASFNVRPAHGHWHCFGCDEGGDVISFVMKIEHLSFVEAIEALAGKAGVELRYEEGGGRDEVGHGRRTRLLEAHRSAEEFYHEVLIGRPEARVGRDFLRERGFDSRAAERFGVGYAPRGGDALVAFLRAKGFTEDELVLGGLVGRGDRGSYDRFRGRLLWPIRDITGSTVGFGARRLHDDDRIGAKYLNTAETPIYKKTSLLYGLDLAKKAVATTRRAVVVEGYTDVMACHLAGVESAVATCGTSFGPDHVAALRRLLRDDSAGGARTVFTFDGDAAGKQAAMRAFKLDHTWASQSYVAVADAGQDPCDLRLSGGDAAVRLLVEQAVPMFEFAVRTTLGDFDLNTAEGRVGAIRAVAPIIAGIRDRALASEYTRTVAGWVGVEVELVDAEVGRAGRVRRGAGPPRRAGSAGSQKSADPRAGSDRPSRHGHCPPNTGSDAAAAGHGDGDPAEGAARRLPAPDLRDPVVDLEHQLLQVLVQSPRSVSAADAAALAAVTPSAPAHQVLLRALLSQWGRHEEVSAAAWVDGVTQVAGPQVESLISKLSVAPIKARVDPQRGGPDPRYVTSLVVRTQESSLRRRIADATGALRRAEQDDPARAHGIAVELTRLHSDMQRLRSRLT